MITLQFIIADIYGRALSVCPGTIKSFSSYEEARAARRYGGSEAKFVGLAVFNNNKLANKNILWEDGIKNWHLGESLQNCFNKKKL